MSRYRAGRRAEYRVIKFLEDCGYTCTRSASSKGLWDVVAVSSTEVRLIQVAYGRDKRPSEIETFELFIVPRGVAKELWHYEKGKTLPNIRRLSGSR